MTYLFKNESDQKPFLTSNFTNLEIDALPFAFGMIDLPLKSSGLNHKFKSDNKRGIEITAASNIVVFKKEIKSSECKLRNDIMVTHRYHSLLNPGSDEEIEDFLVNHAYECEIIMTNVSPKTKQVTLLY